MTAGSPAEPTIMVKYMRKKIRKAMTQGARDKVTPLEMIDILSGAMVSLVAVVEKQEYCQQMAGLVLESLKSEFLAHGWISEGEASR